MVHAQLRNRDSRDSNQKIRFELPEVILAGTPGNRPQDDHLFWIVMKLLHHAVQEGKIRGLMKEHLAFQPNARPGMIISRLFANKATALSDVCHSFLHDAAGNLRKREDIVVQTTLSLLGSLKDERN
jgi:hypothetical protein